MWSLRQHYGAGLRVMIVDLDAHQGDGHERDFRDDDRVYILDAFTPGIFPNARDVMAAIRSVIYYRHGDTGSKFLAELRRVLPAALADFPADVVVYNAGEAHMQWLARRVCLLRGWW